MAYTAVPRVVTGDLLGASWWNTYIRDDFGFVSTHGHSGAAGDGAANLAGVDTVLFDDQATPAAPGVNKTVIYAKSGRLNQRAGAAGSEERISVVGHTHAGSGQAES